MLAALLLALGEVKSPANRPEDSKGSLSQHVNTVVVKWWVQMVGQGESYPKAAGGRRALARGGRDR